MHHKITTGTELKVNDDDDDDMKKINPCLSYTSYNRYTSTLFRSYTISD